MNNGKKISDATSTKSIADLAGEFDRVHGVSSLAKDYAESGHVDSDIFKMIAFNMAIQAEAHSRPSYDLLKKMVDIAFSGILIVVLSPLLFTIALLVKLGSPGPIFYKQIRTGIYFRPFYIYKFRTMHEGSSRKFSFLDNRPAVPLARPENDPRITKIGNFLRLWCLDELPQLFNVFLGTMSLVGPRPLSPDDSATTPKKYALRYGVKPGMTGLWQVLVRSTNDGLLKIRLDCEYVKNRSFTYDMSLLFRTLRVVISEGLHLNTNLKAKELELISYLDELESSSKVFIKELSAELTDEQDTYSDETKKVS